MSEYEDEEFRDLPRDWDNPDWENASRVHNWRNYVSMRVKDIWQSFTAEQKKALALQAKIQAIAEEWD